MVLEYVEFELKTLPGVLVKQQPEVYNMENATVQARGVQNMRVQNLAITLDKVIHLLKVMKTKDPPIIPLSEKETYARTWMDEKSVRGQIFKIIECLQCEASEMDQITTLGKIREQVNTVLLITENSSEEAYAQANSLIRSKILIVCELLKKMKSECIQVQPLSDILMLYGYTKSYFTTCSSYEKVTSTEVQVRLCDVTGEKRIQGELTADDQAKSCYKGTKEYDSTFILGQLAGWFKQTVDKPNASLSAEKRGTLTYPDLESFIIKLPPKPIKGTVRQITKMTMGTWRPPRQLEDSFDEAEEAEAAAQKRKKRAKKIGTYPIGERDEFFKRLVQAPSFMWPVGNNWAYKNKVKLYGSVQFQSVKVADKTKGGDKWSYFKQVVDRLLGTGGDTSLLSIPN